jgi:ParB/RepB/Spo0J family partition protein
MIHINTSGREFGITGLKPTDIKDVQLHFIETDEEHRLRKLNHEKVKMLAKSILEHGQKQPIGLKRLPDVDFNARFKLVFGLHRYAAIKMLQDTGEVLTPSVHAIIYGEDYPDICCQADEIVENLHRNDLTPTEAAIHAEKYAGILKKLKRVRSANEKRSETSKLNHSKKRETDSGVHVNDTRQKLPSTKEALTNDLGMSESTTWRHHTHVVNLAKTEGYTGHTEIESMSPDEHDAAASLAQKALDKKSTSIIQPSKKTESAIRLDVVGLPKVLTDWCRRRLEDPDKPLTLEVLKATYDALGALISEIGQ